MKRISLICICTTFIVLQGIDRIQNAKASDTSSPILIPVSNPAEGETAPKNHSRKGVRPLPPAEAGEKSGTSLKWKSSLNVAADKNIASREIITTDLYAADPTEENNVSGGEKEPAGAKFARKMPIDDPDAKAEKSSEAPPLLETDSDGDDDQETADSEESSEDSDAEKATEEDEEDAGEKAEESDDQPASETQPSDETFVPEVAQKVTLDPNSVGNPHSAALVRMMYDEIMNGLSQRGISGRYDMFRSYARSTLDRFAANSTGNEVDGRCRLSWYDRLYRDPVRAVFEVEQFSRTLHAGLKGDHRHLGETLKLIRNKLDIPARNDEIRYAQARTPQQAVAEVKRCLENAQSAYARALSTLTLAEQKELGSNLYPVFCANTINGHTIPSRSSGRRLVGIIEKMDRTGIHEALEALIPLTDEKFLRLLATLPEDAFPTVLLGSQRVQRIPTAAGDILIGGRENNVYDLDAPGMQDVACVIDLGGNDIYRDGTCNINRPVFVVIDLAGNDQYIATKPGVQGGSVLGVSMLLDLEGDDVYKAQDVAQGSTLGGAGLLIDYSGDDTYLALRRAQGCALGGVGVLIDRKGNDKYRAALLAQGLGHPGGFGVLEDSQGDDWYYLGGLYLDSYPEHPGYDGWGQGLGAGIRQVANGGIGSLLDGGGDDTYEFDYFGHGGGYWLGVGFCRDFGGNDKHIGATLLDYYGKPRSEARWQRFSNGFGCHYSLGFCFDDEGNDVYDGKIMGLGMAWDMSIGFLCDFGGNDQYAATGGMTQGVGAEAGFGILFDYGGDDTYAGRSHGFANSGITYHSPSDCGSNFSFLIDYGGKDEYGSKSPNNSYLQRGSSGGFLIDRPFDFEAEADKAAAEKAAAEKTVADETDQKPTQSNRRPQPNRQRQQQETKRPTVSPVPTVGGKK